MATRTTYRARRAADIRSAEAVQQAGARLASAFTLLGVLVFLLLVTSCANRQPYGEDLWKGLKHVHDQEQNRR